MKTPFILLSLGVWLVLSFQTAADIIDTYGFSAKNMGKGGAVCAGVSDGSSVFYNPAGLGKIDAFDMDFSYFRTFSSMDISDAPADAADNDDLSFGAMHLDLGLSLNLLSDTNRNIAWGFGLVAMDDGTLAFIEDVEESTYSYVQFGSTVKRITLYTGLGMEIVKDTLWLGIGGHVMISGSAAAMLTLETSSLTTEEPSIPARQDLWMEMDGSLKPILGAIYKPAENINLGVSYKDTTAIDIDRFNANLDLKLGQYAAKIPALLAILASWSPRVYRAGCSYQTGKAEIEVDIVMEQWSDFNQGTAREINRVAPEFKDIYVSHVGIFYMMSKKTNLFTGYVYAPTPVPDQPGASNYLGNDRHIVSIGGERQFDHLFGTMKFPVWAGITLQEQLFKDRTVIKSDGSNYQLQGNIFSLMCTIRIAGPSLE